MTRIETKGLTGPALDWAVAKALGWVSYPTDSIERGDTWHMGPGTAPFGPVMKVADWRPSTNWAQGGPIIEREQIDISFISPDTDSPGFWAANSLRPKSRRDFWAYGHGPTPLIAAMRCLVATKLGDEVEIPAELDIAIEASKPAKD